MLSQTLAKPPAGLSAHVVFEARCEACAILVALGELGLQEAVDVLQVDAVANGLVSEIGQDEVQRLVAKAFTAIRTTKPEEAWIPLGETAKQTDDQEISADDYDLTDSFERLCFEADKKAQARRDREMAKPQAQPHAPQSPVDALLWELRTHGIRLLKEVNCRRRLEDVSAAQLREVNAALIRLHRKQEYPSITDELILLLDAVVKNHD